MAYADFSEIYVAWLQSQLDYIDGKPYANLSVSIDPTYEVTAFKNSVDVNQQKIFHNAADDQVGYLRSIKEIAKSPSDYLNEYADYLKFEMNIVQSNSQKIANTHKVQDNSDKATLNFYATFSPDILAHLATYNPMRIFN
jgi:hypothetical protein